MRVVVLVFVMCSFHRIFFVSPSSPPSRPSEPVFLHESVSNPFKANACCCGSLFCNPPMPMGNPTRKKRSPRSLAGCCPRRDISRSFGPAFATDEPPSRHEQRADACNGSLPRTFPRRIVCLGLSTTRRETRGLSPSGTASCPVFAV